MAWQQRHASTRRNRRVAVERVKQQQLLCLTCGRGSALWLDLASIHLSSGQEERKAWSLHYSMHWHCRGPMQTNSC